MRDKRESTLNKDKNNLNQRCHQQQDGDSNSKRKAFNLSQIHFIQKSEQDQLPIQQNTLMTSENNFSHKQQNRSIKFQSSLTKAKDLTDTLKIKLRSVSSENPSEKQKLAQSREQPKKIKMQSSQPLQNSNKFHQGDFKRINVKNLDMSLQQENQIERDNIQNILSQIQNQIQRIKTESGTSTRRKQNDVKSFKAKPMSDMEFENQGYLSKYDDRLSTLREKQILRIDQPREKCINGKIQQNQTMNSQYETSAGLITALTTLSYHKGQVQQLSSSDSNHIVNINIPQTNQQPSQFHRRAQSMAETNSYDLDKKNRIHSLLQKINPYYAAQSQEMIGPNQKILSQNSYIRPANLQSQGSYSLNYLKKKELQQQSGKQQQNLTKIKLQQQLDINSAQKLKSLNARSLVINSGIEIQPQNLFQFKINNPTCQYQVSPQRSINNPLSLSNVALAGSPQGMRQSHQDCCANSNSKNRLAPQNLRINEQIVLDKIYDNTQHAKNVILQFKQPQPVSMLIDKKKIKFKIPQTQVQSQQQSPTSHSQELKRANLRVGYHNKTKSLNNSQISVKPHPQKMKGTCNQQELKLSLKIDTKIDDSKLYSQSAKNQLHTALSNKSLSCHQTNLNNLQNSFLEVKHNPQLKENQSKLFQQNLENISVSKISTKHQQSIKQKCTSQKAFKPNCQINKRPLSSYSSKGFSSLSQAGKMRDMVLLNRCQSNTLNKSSSKNFQKLNYTYSSLNPKSLKNQSLLSLSQSQNSRYSFGNSTSNLNANHSNYLANSSLLSNQTLSQLNLGNSTNNLSALLNHTIYSASTSQPQLLKSNSLIRNQHVSQQQSAKPTSQKQRKDKQSHSCQSYCQINHKKQALRHASSTLDSKTNHKLQQLLRQTLKREDFNQSKEFTLGAPLNKSSTIVSMAKNLLSFGVGNQMSSQQKLQTCHNSPIRFFNDKFTQVDIPQPEPSYNKKQQLIQQSKNVAALQSDRDAYRKGNSHAHQQMRPIFVEDQNFRREEFHAETIEEETLKTQTLQSHKSGLNSPQEHALQNNTGKNIQRQNTQNLNNLYTTQASLNTLNNTQTNQNMQNIGGSQQLRESTKIYPLSKSNLNKLNKLQVRDEFQSQRSLHEPDSDCYRTCKTHMSQLKASQQKSTLKKQELQNPLSQKDPQILVAKFDLKELDKDSIFQKAIDSIVISPATLRNYLQTPQASDIIGQKIIVNLKPGSKSPDFTQIRQEHTITSSSRDGEMIFSKADKKVSNLMKQRPKSQHNHNNSVSNQTTIHNNSIFSFNALQPQTQALIDINRCESATYLDNTCLPTSTFEQCDGQQHCSSVEIINTKMIVNRSNQKLEVHQYCKEGSSQSTPQEQLMQMPFNRFQHNREAENNNSSQYSFLGVKRVPMRERENESEDLTSKQTLRETQKMRTIIVAKAQNSGSLGRESAGSSISNGGYPDQQAILLEDKQVRRSQEKLVAQQQIQRQKSKLIKVPLNYEQKQKHQGDSLKQQLDEILNTFGGQRQQQVQQNNNQKKNARRNQNKENNPSLKKLNDTSDIENLLKTEGTEYNEYLRNQPCEQSSFMSIRYEDIERQYKKFGIGSQSFKGTMQTLNSQESQRQSEKHSTTLREFNIDPNISQASQRSQQRSNYSQLHNFESSVQSSKKKVEDSQLELLSQSLCLSSMSRRMDETDLDERCFKSAKQEALRSSSSKRGSTQRLSIRDLEVTNRNSSHQRNDALKFDRKINVLKALEQELGVGIGFETAGGESMNLSRTNLSLKLGEKIGIGLNFYPRK